MWQIDFFQVIITGYEILSDRANVGGSLDGWSTWARVLKELSHVLLVSYSALNPLAYCGELLLRTGRKVFRRFWQTMTGCFSCFDSCCNKTPSTSRYCHSEFEMMKSIGITLNGADPIPQQLQELDAQSRILSGLPPNPPPPGSEPQYFKHSSASSSNSSSFSIFKGKKSKSRSTSSNLSAMRDGKKSFFSNIPILDKCETKVWT